MAAAVVLAVAAACDCGGPQTTSAGPRISVTPNPVNIDAVPGRFSEVYLRVTNEGNSVLTFEKDPYFVGDDSDGVAEFGIASKFVESCDGTDRSADVRNTIPSGGCALLAIRYLAKDDGADEVILRFESNDADNPVYDVPINASAQTPDIEVCAFDGETKIDCNVPGADYDVDFGTAPPGDKITRTLKITSKGSRSVRVDGISLAGDVDFKVDPTELKTELAPGGTTTLTTTFEAVAGNIRAATLLIKTNDPDESEVAVQLRATGDGAKICLCVGGEGLPCRPVPVADFGEVSLGGTGSRFLRVQSCGTKPMDLEKLELVQPGTAFSAQFPTIPRAMPNADKFDVPLEFKPTAVDTYEARVNFKTGNEQGYVLLQGKGVENGCRLELPSSIIDFGQVARTIESRREFTVANRGNQDCMIGGATITRGANVEFSVAGIPSVNLVPPGSIAKFTAGYRPLDVVGPDEGDLTITYANASPGSPNSTLKVTLKGTPVQDPICKIVAQPGAGSRFGRTLNFGQVRVNSEKVLPITFQNTGSMNCTINTAVIQGTSLPGSPSDASYFKIKRQAPGTLAPGQTATIEVAFTPTSDRDYGSPLPGFPGGNSFGVNVKVITNDLVTFTGQDCTGGFPPSTGAPGCVAWGLSGKGTRSDLQVLPPDLDFGLVTLGCNSRESDVTLYNVGAGTITISELKVEPLPPPEIFRVIAPPVPFTITGGQQKTIKVRYRPPDANVHTGTMFIKSDATNVSGGNPYVTVGLRGTGTTESHQTDTFTQASRAKTDVLFVIDNSGSMGEEQSALAGNASRFVAVANQLNTDYQIGVITTDPDDKPGELVGSPKIILPGANAASQLASRVRALGTDGSGDERGLQTMQQALSDPLINDPAKNKGFLRADAKLAVIQVSDEEDSSRGTVDFYTDFLKNLKGIYNANLVSLSAIVGDVPGGCSTAAAGERYVTVQQRTNGKFRSICSQDWGQIAADLGLDAFAARSGFQLSRLAVPETIAVKVNGTSIPKTGNWDYEAAGNAVVFTTAAAPAAGATIVIDYETQCL